MCTTIAAVLPGGTTSADGLLDSSTRTNGTRTTDPSGRVSKSAGRPGTMQAFPWFVISMLKYEVLGAPSSRSPIAVKLRASHAGVGALAVIVGVGTDGGLVVLADGGVVVVVEGLALPLGAVATLPFANAPAP